MAAPAPAFAALTGTMIRRAPPIDAACDLPEAVAEAAPAWRDDLRLFGFTWAAGFVFFLAFLS